MTCAICGEHANEHLAIPGHEYEETQGLIDSGELCKDGSQHDWREEREKYGEDADGNRYVWVTYKRCTKCGEEE